VSSQVLVFQYFVFKTIITVTSVPNSLERKYVQVVRPIHYEVHFKGASLTYYFVVI